jgi:transposase-like protein
VAGGGVSARHDDATRAAVTAALLTGQSVSSVADEYNLPRGTVAYWKGQLSNPISEASPNAKTEIGDLLLGYLRANIAALTAQQEVFADKTWLRKQPANELAVLHGVSADKAIRLLEALDKSSEAGEDV